jgi:hypothetical protein
MDRSLSFATWFWLIVPMCTVLVLAIASFFYDRRRGR